MRKLFLVFLFFPACLLAQNDSHYVVASQGDFYDSEDLKWSWTLGEVFTESAIQEQGALTQGFHQSWLKNNTLISEDLDQYEDNSILNQHSFLDDLEFNVFPNPSEGVFNLVVQGEHRGMFYEIYDAAGRLVLSDQINLNYNQFDMSAFDNGLYSLLIRKNDSDQFTSFRIIKQH